MQPRISGITPAYAGKSRSSARPHHSHRDHPRACGEKTEYRALVTAHQGSPPRVRGKDIGSTEQQQPPGITPACAGKRHCPRSRPGRIRDHPRVCGEKHAVPVSLMWSAGSPPRVRGKGLLEVFVPEPLRITPAYAGKRDRPRSGPGTTRDHPRVCGEKRYNGIHDFCSKGSPPRVRGKGETACEVVVEFGITPAYAGKSCSSSVSSSQRMSWTIRSRI